MGLDQYVYFLNEDETTEGKQEDFYYRKHNRLEGWMKNLWESKGNSGEFNCVDVELTEDDILALEIDIHEEDLPETGGFFFGSDSYEDYRGEWGYFEKDCQFIEAAKQALADGKRVIYSSWW